MVYRFFDKNTTGSGVATLANKSMPNYQIANELHKPIIRKFKRRRYYSSLRYSIWGVDLAYIQSLSKYNRGITYLFCAIDIFSKYAWVFPLKDKRGISIANAFQKILISSNCVNAKSKGSKPNKI